MKRGLMLLAAALVAGVVAFFATRSHKMAESRTVLLDAMPELAWVRTELELTDDQFAKVSALHAAYRPKCAEMCRRIAEAQEKLEIAARDNRRMSPGLEAAIREHATTHAECRQAMLKHMYETAALLDEEQSARYLAEMLPFALDHAHAESRRLHSRWSP